MHQIIIAVQPFHNFGRFFFLFAVPTSLYLDCQCQMWHLYQPHSHLFHLGRMEFRRFLNIFSEKMK